MREYTLNMLSHADQVKGQGVLSAYEEELALVTGRLDRLEGDGDDYRIRVRVNARTVGDVTHMRLRLHSTFRARPSGMSSTASTRQTGTACRKNCGCSCR